MQSDSTALVVRDREPDLGECTLEELAALANANYVAMGNALTRAVACAITIGDVLNEARDRFTAVPEWERWLSENFHAGYSGANNYMRLAFYKDKLPAEAWIRGPELPHKGYAKPGLTSALSYVRGLPPIRRSGSQRQLDWKEANRLHKEGLRYSEIATLLGFDPETVRYACQPKARQRLIDAQRRRRERARKAEAALKERQEAQTLRKEMKAEGGPVEEAWNLIRKALDVAQQAYDRSGGEKRRVISATIAALHAAEDEIKKHPRVPS